MRPNTECKLCGGLLDLDNWIHRLFRESQGRWGSVPARGCKGGFHGGLGGGGLMWEGEGGLGWDYWIRRRGGWRFGSKKGVAPISSYSTLRFPGKQTWRLVARMIVIIFKILKRTILHNMCHHCHWWRHLLRIIILRRDAGVLLLSNKVNNNNSWWVMVSFFENYNSKEGWPSVSALLGAAASCDIWSPRGAVLYTLVYANTNTRLHKYTNTQIWIA